MSKRYARRTDTAAVAQVQEIDIRRATAEARLHAHVAGLVEPWTTVEQGHRVSHRSLLEQLGVPADATTQGGSSSKAASKPPVSLDATSLLGEISRDTRRWATDLLGKSFVAGVRAGATSERRTVQVLLLQLERRSAVLDWEDLDELGDTVMRWWARARLALAWDSPPIKPHVPCPQCGAWDKVQVTVGPPHSAACRECHAAWDSATIDALGVAVETYLALRRQQLAEPDLVRAVIDRGAGRVTGYDARADWTVLAGVGPDAPWREPLPDTPAPGL